MLVVVPFCTLMALLAGEADIMGLWGICSLDFACSIWMVYLCSICLLGLCTGQVGHTRELLM